MAFNNWILPFLIGFISSVLLLSILYNPYAKDKFSDLGALIQLNTSKPVYYIAATDVPDTPIYNYYPQTALNPNKNINMNTNNKMNTSMNNNSMDLAFNNPMQNYDSHKAFYWALSGGYPYPVLYYPDTNMNNVKANQNKI